MPSPEGHVDCIATCRNVLHSSWIQHIACSKDWVCLNMSQNLSPFYFFGPRTLSRFWGHLSSLKYAKIIIEFLDSWWYISLQFFLFFVVFFGCWKWVGMHMNFPAEFWDRATTVFEPPTFSGRSRNSTQLCRLVAQPASRLQSASLDVKDAMLQWRTSNLLSSGTTASYYSTTVQSNH